MVHHVYLYLFNYRNVDLIKSDEEFVAFELRHAKVQLIMR